MSDNEIKFKSDKVLECPMCGEDVPVTDKKSNDEDPNDRQIEFQYECDCGMLMYYPFKVSEVPDGESYFE